LSPVKWEDISQPAGFKVHVQIMQPVTKPNSQTTFMPLLSLLKDEPGSAD